MFFNDWDSTLRVVVMGTLGYVALIVLLRVSGKRTLSKMNAFDFIITITLGSAFASLMVSKTVTLADGVVALSLLVALQYMMTWIYVRSQWFEQLVTGVPQLLFWRGNYLESILKRERVSKEEVQAAMRNSNVTSYETSAAVLKTDGSITVFLVEGEAQSHAMREVRVD
ncbi:MAG TPA: YetF domain-containing protein [Acidimicrobiia bacterium]|nr:YetF domain-containing protein [Acidimicrobiia bacterium]